MDYGTICAKVIEIAKTAGAYIREARAHMKEEHVSYKGKNNPVTAVDIAAEKMLVQALSDLLPGSGFLTEEKTVSREGEYTWVIDPLDGTVNYLHGIPVYSVSIGLMHEGKIKAGVIYEITRDECFYAWEGGKAWLNGKEIQVSGTLQLKDALLATGFPYSALPQLGPYMDLLRHLIGNTRAMRRLGSAAADLAYVACGRFDVFYEYHLNPWDVAAGTLIVQEAGGVISDFRGGDDYLHGQEIIACNRHVFPEMLEAVNAKFR